MIPDEEKEGWHYLSVKKLSPLLRTITSKHDSDFYSLNYLHSFRTDNKIKSHEKVYKYKEYCRIARPSEKDNILEFNQYVKSDKMPYIIYADIASLIKKIDVCANNPEKSSTANTNKHIPCGYSMSTIWAFNHIGNKHTLYRWEDCMKKFCESLTKHAKNIIDFEKKRRTKITSRCKGILHLWKNNVTKARKK